MDSYINSYVSYRLWCIFYKKHTIIETKNFSAKVFIVTTIIAAVTALLIYKRGFGVGHLLAIVTILAVIFGYINEKGLFFGFLTPYFQTISYSALFLFHMVPGITEVLRRFPSDNPIVIDSNVDHPILISFYITFFISYLIITTNQIKWLKKEVVKLKVTLTKHLLNCLYSNCS